jgi:hypothetical protein
MPSADSISPARTKLSPLPGEEIFEGIEAMNLVFDAQTFPSGMTPVFSDLVKRYAPKTIIEVGSWKGVSAKRWLDAAGPACKLYCVDTWLTAADAYLKPKDEKDYAEPNQNGHCMVYWTFLNNLRVWGLTKQVVPIVNTSSVGSDVLKAHGVWADIIYIDGDHSYRAAYQDLCDYWDLLRPGGGMLVDDYKLYPGVYAACIRFIEEKQLWRNHQALYDSMFCLLEKPL